MPKSAFQTYVYSLARLRYNFSILENVLPNKAVLYKNGRQMTTKPNFYVFFLPIFHTSFKVEIKDLKKHTAFPSKE